MHKRLRIILYGDSIVLAGMRLSLEANPAFQVISIAPPAASEQELLALQPDVVIFDISSVQPRFHSNLIQRQHEVQLIGVDPDREHVLVWSGKQTAALGTAGLIRMIQQGRGGARREAEAEKQDSYQ